MDTSADQPLVPKPETGEEAYLRRLQMSQGIIRAPVPAVPTFVQPKPSPTEAPMSTPMFVAAQSPPKDDVSPHPPEATVAASFTPLTQDAIEERKKAAAAVAARLAALTKAQTAPPSEATQA
jgi:splicing factor 45